MSMMTPDSAPECDNCRDTGRVSTDVPGHAAPLTSYCFKNCNAAKAAIASDAASANLLVSHGPLWINNKDNTVDYGAGPVPRPDSAPEKAAWKMTGAQTQAVIERVIAEHRQYQAKRNPPSFSWEHVVEAAVAESIVIPMEVHRAELDEAKATASGLDLHKYPRFGCDCGKHVSITYDGLHWFPAGHGEDMGECAARGGAQ